MIDRNLAKNIDWLLILLLLANSALGVIFIHSSSEYLRINFTSRQISWIIISLVVLFLLLVVDYKIIIDYSPYLFIVLLFVLLTLLIFGLPVAGTRGWIRFLSFQVQPSELGKAVVILILSYIFSNYREKYLSFRQGLVSVMVVSLPVILVALQPDLGTSFTYLFIILAAFLLAGLKKKALIILLITTISIGVLGWNFALKDYQKKRVKTVIYPMQDPRGSGYHLLQSKIAVGSGGILGKGYKKGSQTQLMFIPARHTDFIFSVIGEEAGFLGVTMSMALYLLFLIRIFRSAFSSRDRAGIYLVFMVSILFTSQFLINVLMVIGLFPIAGIPLPLLSYGGSSLLTSYICVSFVLNVKMRRFVNV